MSVIEVIPTHLIDTDGEQRFKIRIDTVINKFRQYQFINEKRGSMTVIENKRVT